MHTLIIIMKRGAIFHTANYLLAVIIQMHSIEVYICRRPQKGTHKIIIIIDVILDLFLCKNNELYCFDTLV